MDWNRPGKLLRPNPDWEEDLFLTCVVGPDEIRRLKEYATDVKRRKKPRICTSEEEKPSVPVIKLNNGRYIPGFGLGTWLGRDRKGIPIPLEDFSIQAAVEAAIDCGYRLFDTAASYNNEFQVGKAIRKKIAQKVIQREDVFVITKLWNDKHAEKDVVLALEESLQRLRLDYVDLYLIHWPVGVLEDGTFDETDYLDTWNGMIEARVRGLTKSIGVSNFNQHQLDRVITLSKVKPAVLQIEMNLNLQQKTLRTFCRSNKIAVIAYTPFGSLFHQTAAFSAPPPREDTLFLLKLAKKYGKSTGQIALRYLLDLGVIPIPKSTNLEHIEENFNVFDFKLTKEEHRILKGYDKNYRTLPVTFWKKSPYYPFEK